MTPGNKDRDGPPPPDDEGRSLLFGWSKEDEEAGEGREQPSQPPASASSPAPPATVPAAKDVGGSADPPDLAGTLVSLAAGQRHILAMLGDIAAADGEGRAGVAEIARMVADMKRMNADMERMTADIKRMTADIKRMTADIKRMTAETAEWTNQNKAVTNTLHAASGQQIEGLKGERGDLAKVVAELKIREEGIAGRLETFGKALPELDTLLKRLDRRSSELEELKQEFAEYYGRWTAAFEPVLEQMATLSERLDASNHPLDRFDKQARSWTEAMAKSMGRNTAEQRAAAEQTSGNVGKLAEAGDAFLKRFDAGSREALAFFRRERQRIRRRTVPALVAALAFAVPSSALIGALGQSELGIFYSLEVKDAVERVVWSRYRHHLTRCSLDAVIAGRDVTCRFKVTSH